MVVMAKMEVILTSAVFISILLLIPKIQSQSNFPPLCIAQFAQLNGACAYVRPPDDDDDDSSPPSPPDGDVDVDRGRMDNITNQSLVDDDDGDDDHSHHNHHHRHHRRHHHHRRRHRQRHRASDAEEDCCTLLKAVDDVCVCSLLLRLPPFLTKLKHEYTVLLNNECNVTFECQDKYGD